MAVRLTVLSGSLQGHVLETTDKVIGIGTDHADLIRFDSESDPEIKGQRVRLELRDDRWRLFNDSAQPLFINQDLVRADAGLRSGDLIRLSQDGPDLQFELEFGDSIKNPSIQEARAAQVSKKQETAAQERRRKPSQAVSPDSSMTSGQAMPNDEGDPSTGVKPLKHSPALPPSPPLPMPKATGSNTPSPRSRRSNKPQGASIISLMTIVAVPMGGLAGICIAVVLLWVIWKKDPLGVIAPSANNIASAPVLKDTSPQENDPPRTSVTTPKTLPEKLRQTPSTEPTTSRQSAAANQSDFTIDAFEQQSIDILETPTFAIDLSRNVRNPSQETISFRKDPDTPGGITIDPLTGLLTWAVPPGLAGQSISIPFLVGSTRLQGPLKRGSVSLQVICGDNKTDLTNDLFASIYLLAAKTGPEKKYLPLGTACSIGPHTLLTSATVAMALVDARKRKWEIAAFLNAADPRTELHSNEIESVYVHSIYDEGAKRPDSEASELQKAYFDLALVKTTDPMTSSVALRKTAEGQIDTETFTCLAYPITGRTLTNLAELSPTRHESTLIARIPPRNSNPNTESPPLLLQFQGGNQTNSYGGVFIDQDSDVVGIYTFSAPSNARGDVSDIHYATETVTAQSYLNGIGVDFWVPVYEAPKTQ